ncbi:MAG: hypothetical protein ACI3W5_05525 [Faecousia sp.]
MNISQLKSDALRCMRAAGKKPYQLTFLSVAVSVAAAVVVALVGTAVNNFQGGEGLSGMGPASMLQALEQSLNMIIQLLSPFWAVGLVAALFAIAHGHYASKRTLLEGFRRFFPFLRLYLLKFMLMMAVATLTCVPAMLLYSLTPWAVKLQAEVAANPDLLENVERLMKEMLPFMAIYGVVLLAVLVPLLYRLRFADYLLISGWKAAMAAMAASFRLTKGWVKTLFLLDLSFWWYYLGSALLLGVCYLDVVIGLFGHRLNMDAQAAYWVCYLCYAAGHLALETYARPRVEGAHVLLFRAVFMEAQAQTSV